MILLLGGTRETAAMAEALTAAGYRAIVSTATEIPLSVGDSPDIVRRKGPLIEGDMAALIREKKIKAIVDVTHPYAAHVRATAERVAGRLGIPYLTFVRPGVLSGEDGVSMAANHEDAARLAFETGKPVLLTVGSKNVRPYAEESRRAGVPLMARVLAHPESIEACLKAGIPEERILTGRGPFTVEENLQLIRRFGIGVIVTKDSGEAGGVRAKLEAARIERCRLVVVQRPALSSKNRFDRIEDVVHALKRWSLSPPTNTSSTSRNTVTSWVQCRNR
ncbi:MAG: precorrin-6A reductase [Verrucomicrobia bacterium]|nr:precorrin-6A reductase [Verrucomicrobiota bacterium]